MGEQIRISIGFEAREADVFQYGIVGSQQILGLLAVAVSLDKNFGHPREKPQPTADTWMDLHGGSGLDHHGHGVSLSCISEALFWP
jgi:hypothetical protein